MSIIVYDLEIIKAIQSRGEAIRPGIEYCGGWDDHAGMGISAITAYDYAADRYRVFLEDNFGEFVHLCKSRPTIIGFNSIQFDDRVCAAAGLDVVTTYDLRVEILNALKEGKFARGLNLDAIAAANLGTTKSGHGADAPANWQKGLKGDVIDYCLEDTRITKKIVDRILRFGELIDPRNKRVFPIRRP